MEAPIPPPWGGGFITGYGEKLLWRHRVKMLPQHKAASSRPVHWGLFFISTEFNAKRAAKNHAMGLVTRVEEMVTQGCL